MRAALVLATLLSATVPTLASDIAASSASSAASASSGSVSDSVRGSSRSSTGDRQVAAGRYRVVEVAASDEREGTMRVAIQSDTVAGPEGAWTLLLPQRVVAREALAAGDRLDIGHRDFGLTLARAAAAQPFFLVLHDERQRELPAHPV